MKDFVSGSKRNERKEMCRQWFAFQSLFSGLWGPSENNPRPTSILDLYQ